MDKFELWIKKWDIYIIMGSVLIWVVYPNTYYFFVVFWGIALILNLFFSVRRKQWRDVFFSFLLLGGICWLLLQKVL